MRTYDAATYSDLSQNATVYMIQPAMITGLANGGGNRSSFTVMLDGAPYTASVGMDGKVHVSVDGDDKLLYTAVAAGGRRRMTRRNRNRDSRNRNRNSQNRNRNSSNNMNRPH
jgi:hypothetical protein